MAYAQDKARTQQVASAGMVVALQVGIGAVLLATFAGGMQAVLPPKTDPRAFDVPIDMPPPPPSPTTSPSVTRDPVIDRPESTFTLTPLDRDLLPLPTTTPLDPGPIGPVGTSTTRAVDPSPSPSAAFLPRSARPKTSPGTWATTLDYPARAIREGREGTTAFRVSIGTDGRVTDCMIIRSSGSQDLDDATCAKVSKRAKFEPATDSAGNPVAGSYANSIRWVLPK